MGIRFEKRMAGAEDAVNWLTDNPRNRNVSKARLATMRRDMLSGNWYFNPHGIVLAPSGRLIDGQHRLLALIEADREKPGIKIPLVVAYDVPEAVFDVLDIGGPRSAANILQIHGHGDANPLATATKQVIRYEAFPDRVWTTGTDVSKTEIAKFVQKHADQVELLDKHRAGLASTPVNYSSFMALNWLVIRHSGHGETWADFSDGVITGAGLEMHDPRLTLRNRSLKWVEARSGYGQARIAMYVKCWNAFVLGREVRQLRWSKSELPMPDIK